MIKHPCGDHAAKRAEYIRQLGTDSGIVPVWLDYNNETESAEGRMSKSEIRRKMTQVSSYVEGSWRNSLHIF